MIGACLLGVVGWRLGGVPDTEPAPPTPAIVQEVVSEAQGGIVVHVAGLVERPGLVTLAVGSRVFDAIVAAGGLIPGARVETLNLAAPVSDGERLVVGSEAAPDGEGIGGTGLIPVNRATADELEALPGVGPVLAGRIVAHREENGPFSAVEDLLAVTGIGERMLASLRDLISVP